MREIGTPKIGSDIMNSHIKRPRNTINWRIGSGKKAIFQSHIHEIADKKTAYNKGRLYICCPGVNFINALRAAFAHVDPKSVKRYQLFY
jgi:hypothetical protein